MNLTEEFPAELVLDAALEMERMHDLRSLDLLDTPPEERFDRITRLAAEFFQVPTAYVAFMDNGRQWFKSRFGPCPTETTRAISFCQYTLTRDAPLIMPDVRDHPIGRGHPMVLGEPFLRFYAGIPLSGPRGQKIGTFCLVGLEPRPFGPVQIAQLTSFAAIVEREMNLGQIILTQNELLKTRAQLLETQQELEREFADAAKYVRRMLPPPLTGNESLEWEFYPSAHLGGDGLGYRKINEDQLAIYVLDVTGHGLGSALLAVSALEFLRSQIPRDFDFSKPAQVVERLNQTFQMKDHAGKFFSVWYGVYSRSSRTITYVNAGHPPALLLNQKNGVFELIQTLPSGPVLGVLPNIHAPEITVPFPAGSEIFLFTDGLYEVLDARGEHGSFDEFLKHLQDQILADHSAWEALLEWSGTARRRNSIDDDVSLMRFITAT